MREVQWNYTLSEKKEVISFLFLFPPHVSPVFSLRHSEQLRARTIKGENKENLMLTPSMTAQKKCQTVYSHECFVISHMLPIL